MDRDDLGLVRQIVTRAVERGRSVDRRPTVGRPVQYQLTEDDVAAINLQYPLGTIRRNPVRAGQLCAAVITAVTDRAGTSNLQVFIDGDVSYWALGRTEGPAPGSWSTGRRR